MNPLIGIILIVLWGVLNALIAHKRRRSGAVFFLWSTITVMPVWWLMIWLSGGDGTIAGWFAFIPPAVAFIAALFIENGPEAAARTGEHGDYVRCAFCAEPVRREAVKCRYCGSSLTKSAATRA